MRRKTLADVQMENFIVLFNSIEKTISFNELWAGPNGSLRGVIEHPVRRIIMQEGETAKFFDRFGRKVVLIGSQFGTVAIYPAHLQASLNASMPLAFDISPAFAYAYSHKHEKDTKTSGLLKDEQLFGVDPDDIWQLTRDLADYCKERCLFVGDGYKVPKKDKRRHVVRDPKKQQAKAPQGKPKADSKKSTPLKPVKKAPLQKIEEPAATPSAEAPVSCDYSTVPAEFQGQEPMAA